LIGTILDNTTFLLAPAANALLAKGEEPRIFRTESEQTWLNMMIAVHRSFLASLQTATEAGLVAICKEAGIEVVPARRDEALKVVESIRSRLDAAPIARELVQVEKLGGNRPEFSDYLEAVLKTKIPRKDRRKVWRRLFDALSILRNKASHSDVSLTQLQRSKLTGAGLSPMIDAGGNLQINPRMYVQLASYVLDFLDDVLAGGSPAATSTPTV
jgi:hypothetical protein